MIKINKKVEYALMAIKYISEKGETDFTAARELCDQLEIPFDTTSKVLQKMNTEGYLESIKGINGGYRLKAKLSDISFLKIYRLIDGPQQSFCETSKGLCELHQTCNIASPLELLNKQINLFFDGLSLEELFRDGPHTPLELINDNISVR